LIGISVAVSALAKPRRALCVRCERPQSSCICRWIYAITTPIEVLILQHPNECKQAKGSARLLHLSLPNSRLVSVENLAVDDLASLLFDCGASAPKQPLLLYPADAHNPRRDDVVATELSQIRLVVLDGTWRESRAILARYPLLQRLPRLTLNTLAPSKYLIRKAQRAEQRSTLEASCMALAQLSADSDLCAPLLAAFEGFVVAQLARRNLSVKTPAVDISSSDD
jgi:DTW domain-containing protein